MPTLGTKGVRQLWYWRRVVLLNWEQCGLIRNGSRLERASIAREEIGASELLVLTVSLRRGAAWPGATAKATLYPFFRSQGRAPGCPDTRFSPIQGRGIQCREAI